MLTHGQWQGDDNPPSFQVECAYLHSRSRMQGVTGALLFEAVNRVIRPEPVDGKGEQPVRCG